MNTIQLLQAVLFAVFFTFVGVLLYDQAKPHVLNIIKKLGHK